MSTESSQNITKIKKISIDTEGKIKISHKWHIEPLVESEAIKFTIIKERVDNREAIKKAEKFFEDWEFEVFDETLNEREMETDKMYEDILKTYYGGEDE